VYIAKANGKQRPLGMPVIADRALQAQVVNSLEPEWEARLEAKSYGFHPGRGCHDALESIYKTLCGKSAKRLWALDADLASGGIRPDRPLPPPQRSRQLPGKGADRGVAEGARGRQGPICSD